VPAEKKPETGEKAPAAAQHPWHSSRGGVIVIGKIVGREGDLLFVADTQGHRFRIPYSLLASGAQDHARAQVTQLEGKPYVPAVAKTKPSSDVESPAAVTPAVRPQVRPPATAGPSSPVRPAPVVQSTPQPAPRLPAAGGTAASKPMGEARKWKMKGNGMVMAEGRLVELRKDTAMVERSVGSRVRIPIPLELLSDADRQYAETIARGEKPAAAPPGAIEVQAENPRLSWSLDRQSMLLLDGRALKMLSPDGTKLMATHALEAETLLLLERPQYYVAASGKNLLLLDKTTLKAKAKHELWKYQRIRDLTLVPDRRVAIASVENALDEVRQNRDERQRIVIVDEKTGDVTEPDGVYGTWVVAEPSGKYLLTGYKDVYKEDGDLHVNPDGHVIEIPQYANVDVLRRFRIEGRQLTADDAFKNAGGNGQGLVLSPDGRRITYLSYTGYPTFSGNVAAFDLTNFKKKPVSYAMKGRADCKKLVYHPVLNLVASPGGGSAVCFDSQSGEVLPDRIEGTELLAGCVVHDLAFSADGRKMVFVVSKGGGARYLLTAPLRLGSVEMAQLRSGATLPAGRTAAPVADEEATVPPQTVKPTLRTWTDATGKFRIEAEYAGADLGIVRLKKKNGTLIQLPLDKLSQADQKFVHELIEKGEK
jgi:hypothetical protein